MAAGSCQSCCTTDFTLQHDLQVFLDSHLKANMGPKYLFGASLQHENIINYKEYTLLNVLIYYNIRAYSIWSKYTFELKTQKIYLFRQGQV